MQVSGGTMQKKKTLFQPTVTCNIYLTSSQENMSRIFHSIVVSMPACHAGDPGSIKRSSRWESCKIFFLLLRAFTPPIGRNARSRCLVTASCDGNSSL